MGCCAPKSKDKSSIIALESIQKPGLSSYNMIHANSKNFLDQYKVEQCLGSGSFGEVRKVIHKLTGQERAVKLFLKSSNELDSYSKVKQEIQILSSLHHPSIIRIYEYFEDEKRLYIVLEKCDGGELFDMITSKKYLGESVAAVVIKQILSAVAYMHENFIVHRDIKPENILLEETEDFVNLKIIDFGTATKYSKNEKITGIVGSTFYLAPEVVSNSYGPECDLWSCGVILFIMLSGYPPFDGKNNNEIFNKIIKMQFDFSKPVWEGVSSHAKDLVSKLLQPSNKRISAQEALNHPWLISNSSHLTPRHDLIETLKTNLQEFHCRNKLHSAITAFISNQIISSKETKDLRELFKAMDLNGDGKLSREELFSAFDSDNPLLVNKIMQKVDADNNGFIDFDEFLQAALHERQMLSKENLKQAFDMFDLDASGKISFNELRTVLGIGLSEGKKIWDEIMTSKNHAEDDEISFQEFCNIISLSNKI
jgi:calcium-dependent protein kinase